MAYDTFLAKDGASKWYDKHVDTGKQLIKIGASIGGCVLLGLRIDIWVNKRSDKSDMFQTRDVLKAIALMFTFDDTSYFIKALGGRSGRVRRGWRDCGEDGSGLCAHRRGRN